MADPPSASSSQLAELVRQDLAAQVHDDLVPFLFVAQQAIANEQRKTSAAAGKDPDEHAQMLGKIDDWICEAMRVARSLIQQSSPSPDQTSTWWSNLQRLAETLYPGEKRIRFETDSAKVFAQTPLTPDHAIAFYRVAAEAIRNAVKHSDASDIVVRLSLSDQPSLLVHDNGKGFDANGVGPDRFGLALMRAQAVAAKGELRIDSTPGGPTQIEVSV